jgi:hypothetical protein
MFAPLRMRFWLEAGLASVCGALAVLTLFVRDWIEALTRFDPDYGNGSLEWALVGGLALACVASGVAARREWRRIRAAAFAST